MSQTLQINSINFSGEQANIIFTPENQNISYGLGIQTLPFIFDSSTLGNNINALGKYSINIINSNCTYILIVN